VWHGFKNVWSGVVEVKLNILLQFESCVYAVFMWIEGIYCAKIGLIVFWLQCVER